MQYKAENFSVTCFNYTIRYYTEHREGEGLVPGEYSTRFSISASSGYANHTYVYFWNGIAKVWG